MGAHRASRSRRRASRHSRASARGGRLLWGAGVLAAVVLVTSANGSLASWTAAVLTNDTNTVATGKAVMLTQTDGATTCRSSSQPSNSATCSTINLYGGTTATLMPGASRNVDITFTNSGAAPGTTFSLAPGACSQTPNAGSGTPAATDLCTASGELAVAIGCSAGATYNAGAAWADLGYAAAVPPTATKNHATSGGDLGVGAQWTCRVTVAVAAGASVASQNITVTQPVTWTLSS